MHKKTFLDTFQEFLALYNAVTLCTAMECSASCISGQMVSRVLSPMGKRCHNISREYKTTDRNRQSYHSPERKISPTYPHEIAGNMSNKCTFINSNSPWKSKNQVWLYFYNTIVWLPAFCWAATIKSPWLHKFPDISLFSWLFTDFSRIPWHFHVSRNSRKVVTVNRVMAVCQQILVIPAGYEHELRYHHSC